jgi:hypothetical protein
MKMLALAILLISFPWVAHASGRGYSNQERHYHHGYDRRSFWQDVEQRKHRQHIRIDRGIEKGQLTRREIKTLAREQRHVAKQIKHFKHHRHMSHANKKSVMRHMNHYSDQIARLKHNDHYVRRGRHNHHENKIYDRSGRRLSWASNDYVSELYY